MTLAATTSKPVLKISDVFSTADSVSYGPFTVTQGKNQTIAQARFHADNFAVPMRVPFTAVATLMIAKQGEALTRSEYAAQIKGYLQSYISRIRSTMRDELKGKIPQDRLQKLMQCFTPVNPLHIYGERGKTMGPEMAGAYKISLGGLE